MCRIFARVNCLFLLDQCSDPEWSGNSAIHFPLTPLHFTRFSHAHCLTAIIDKGRVHKESSADNRMFCSLNINLQNRLAKKSTKLDTRPRSCVTFRVWGSAPLIRLYCRLHPFFLYKNLFFYQNVEAEINQNFKNVLRTFLRLEVD